MYAICRLSIWAVLLCSCKLLLGQEEAFYFHHLTVEQGLTSQSFNYYILKDSEGFVWFSSINGLNRYDGRKIKAYLPEEDDTLSLTSSNIHSMFFEDKKNRLWFSTNVAIQCYDRNNDNFIRYYAKEQDKIVEGEHQLLFLDTLEEKIWVRINNALYIKSTAQKDELHYVGEFPMNHRAKMEKGKNKGTYFLFIPKNDGLYIWLFQNGQVLSPRNYGLGKIFPGIKVLSYFLEDEEHIWAGTDKGLMYFNLQESNPQQYTYFKDLKITDINGILPLNDELIIIATQAKGIYYFNKVTKKIVHQFYINDEGNIKAFQPPIDKIYLDNDFTLWVSTNGDGIYYTNLKKKKFQAFLQNRSAVPTGQNQVQSMTEDNSGRIWCLTKTDIIVLFLGEKESDLPRIEQRWRNLPFTKENPFYIFCDRSNRKWICAASGIYVLLPGTSSFIKVQVDSKVKLNKPGFAFLTQLSNDKILASSQSDGILEIIEEKGQFVLRRFQHLPNQTGVFTRIYEDNKGRVYFCKNAKNIYVFRQEKGILSLDTTLVLTPMVNALVEDNNGQRIWIATTQGLFQLEVSDSAYQLQQDTVFTVPSALNGLLQDNEGRLWISTNNNGIIRYTPGKKSWRVYKQAEGLQSSEFNFWSFVKTRKRLFGFGGVNGVNFFYPSDIEDLQIKARPAITDILINDVLATDLICAETQVRNISLIKKLVRPYSQNTLSFRFAALEYSDPSANQFSYQLKNVDDTLVNIGTENFARYANLSPGNYTFEVHATNSDGVWSDQVARLKITIRPPWWQTWWARTLFGLIIVGIIYGIYRDQIARIKRREAFRRKEAEYKQKEAENNQLIAETETAVLRLQMNPHFIFNSMNSISSYILQKDIDTANDYLSRFAKLMRMILKFAEKPFITVGEEIDLLEQYLQTEAMRLEKKFTYHFEVAPDLDPDEVILPTMILQPFVENAIWHGLSPKEGEGRIDIRFWLEINHLYCSIEDNGIGRVAAAKKSPKAHDSKALSLTERRLKLLENANGSAGSFEIIDLYDAEAAAMGTRVLLRLPLL